MKVIGVIPARLHSTRFPGKVLADLCGKPMIQHVYERARLSKYLSDLWVACDDASIVKAVESFGGKVKLTSSHHVSGTDRVAEIVKDIPCDGVINIQADEPLLGLSMVDQVVEGLLEPEASVSTLAKVVEEGKDFRNPNVVKVVCDEKGFALYFSRAAIPYLKSPQKGIPFQGLRHIGLYGYKKDFLMEFSRRSPSSLELIESLEQLRVLEMGRKIKVVLTSENSIGVDTPEDLARVSRQIS
ncbi:MAG: 3-deoxy-manno-octulosonate cytidylyltransferase [Chlamydiae bacterium]|nr:3-deoxy-manno-octulosonate cytidylyltransferase [Chlamydiota bacterium]MBI3277478.1 3-deoxy-manno-octulosonate cytidylyltransferase [Chlamydiota bacterium]